MDSYMEVRILQVQTSEPVLSSERWSDGTNCYYVEPEATNVFIESPQWHEDLLSSLE